MNCSYSLNLNLPIRANKRPVYISVRIVKLVSNSSYSSKKYMDIQYIRTVYTNLVKRLEQNLILLHSADVLLK